MDEEKRVFSENHVEMIVYQCHTEEELISSLGEYEVIGNQYAPLTERVFSRLCNLKLVVRYGVGINNIDIAGASKHGVCVCNVPDYGIQEVSAHALAMMMALSRKLIIANSSVSKGEWKYSISTPIYRYSGQTIGIIGFGRIGKNFAKLIRPLGTKIIAVDPHYQLNTSIDTSDDFSFVRMTELDELLEISDIVSIHCPLETAFHMIGKRELQLMKRNALLLNVSRGGIIEESALETALAERWIAGAACDVLEEEPPKGIHPLLKYENFICTPHMAWYSIQAAQDLKRKLAEEIVRYLDKKDLLYQLN
jgi:D-3-phosphoglycerate dehydrogenase